MRMTKIKKYFSVAICIVLIVSIVLFVSGCGREEAPEAPTTQSQSVVKELGEGKTEFNFSAIDLDGNETKFIIHTDKAMLGEALSEVGLVEGEEGQYGLYVKTVNGVTADYEKDGTYWALYVNDDYALKGVDLTPITEGESYSYRVTK